MFFGLLFFAPCLADEEVNPSQPPELQNYECEDAVDAATDAAVGPDQASLDAVNQTVSSATENTGEGTTAKVYEGTALIHGAMAAAALKRCKKCERAIEECKKTCDTQIENARKPCQGQLDKTSCVTEEDRLRKLRKECSAKQSECQASCTQAYLSGMQSLLALAGKNTMTDCKGEDCNKKQAEEKKCDPTKEICNPGSLPSNPGGSSPLNIAGPTLPFGGGGNTGPSPNLGSLAGGNKTTNSNKKKDIVQVEGRGEEGALLGSPAHLGSSPSTMAGSSPSTKGSNLAMTTGPKKNEENSLVNEEPIDKLASSSPELFGAGALVAGYKYNSDRQITGDSSRASSLDSKKDKDADIKVAMADKGSLGSGKAKENIFSQMSRIITKVCYTEQKCYHKKQ